MLRPLVQFGFFDDNLSQRFTLAAVSIHFGNSFFYVEFGFVGTSIKLGIFIKND